MMAVKLFADSNKGHPLIMPQNHATQASLTAHGLHNKNCLVDNLFAELWKQIGMKTLLARAGFKKRSGTPISELVYLLMLWTDRGKAAGTPDNIFAKNRDKDLTYTGFKTSYNTTYMILIILEYEALSDKRTSRTSVILNHPCVNYHHPHKT